MSSDIDDVIREAVRRQERLAPPAERVRAALPGRAARYARRRRTAVSLVAVTTATAAVAVAIAVPGLLREPDGGRGVGTPPASTSAPTPSPAPGSARLRFAPTWLPAGMAERTRSAPVSDTPSAKTGVTRVWSRIPLAQEYGFTAQGANLTLYATAAGPDPGADHVPPVPVDDNGQPVRGGSTAHEVDINGRPGRIYQADLVSWHVDEKTKLTLMAPGLDLSEADLLRIARSVRPDTAVLPAPLRLGWLPDGLVAQDITVSGNAATEWEAGVVAEQKPGPDVFPQRFLAAYLGTQTRPGVPETGELVDVAGRPARLTRVQGAVEARPGYRAEWALVVDLGDGRHLTVLAGTGPTAGDTPAPTREDVIRVAEHVELAEPDLAWLPTG